MRGWGKDGRLVVRKDEGGNGSDVIFNSWEE